MRLCAKEISQNGVPLALLPVLSSENARPLVASSEEENVFSDKLNHFPFNAIQASPKTFNEIQTKLLKKRGAYLVSLQPDI